MRWTAAAPRDALRDVVFRPPDLRPDALRPDDRETLRPIPRPGDAARLRPRADVLAEDLRAPLADFLRPSPPDFRALERPVPPLFRPPDFLNVAISNSVIGWFAKPN